jgi:hypothetical protein
MLICKQKRDLNFCMDYWKLSDFTKKNYQGLVTP